MMYRIRLLNHQDFDTVRAYLDKDPLYNTYLIHGLEAYGLDSKHARFWGAFRGDWLEGVMFTDVLLADYDNSPRCGCLAGDNPEVLAQLGKFSLKTDVRLIKGKSAYIEPAARALSSRVKDFHLTNWNFYRADPGQSPLRYDYPVRAATREDMPLLMELYRDFELGSRDLRQVEYEVQQAVDRSTCFFVELRGKAASASMVVAETDRTGMMNYARTLPEFRGRHLHLSVRTACYDYLLKQGKVALGVFSESNAAMNKIVSKYGSIVGKWSVVYFTRKPPLRQRVIPYRLRKLGVSVKNRLSDWVRLDAVPGRLLGSE
jgi:hypothetical protein